MIEELIITRDKLVTYLKKFWWLLLLCFIIGGIVLGIGVYSSGNSSEKTISYEQEIIPVKVNKNSMQNITISNIVGNCTTFLNVEEVQKEINDLLESQDEVAITDWEGISLEVLGNSSLFGIKIMGEQAVVKAQIDAIVTVLNEKMEHYGQEVELVMVGDLKNYVEVEQNRAVLLKDIVIFLAIILCGLICIYLLMVFDRHISSPSEINAVLGKEAILQISINDIKLLEEWCKILNKKERTVLLFGDGTEKVQKKLETLRMNNIHITTFEKYGETLIKEAAVKIYLVIKSMETEKGELNTILQLNKLYDKQFDGWVYLKL